MSHHNQKVVTGLEHLLADTYLLYLKTHYFHWNVTGPLFFSLHSLFEVQYQELFLAVDEIAERIRALGSYAPGTTKEFIKLSKIKEAVGVPAAEEMLKLLAEDHRIVTKTSYNVFEVANKADDQATIELVTRRMQVHEKAMWMLNSQTSL
ncbi:MAG: hypothetical protein ACD_44C00201G0010 [uncultured bacterium]|nr:MAG: hypothetical protein ACD_44C00201G0010 [uncultured bacterium]OGT16182.1 MAG: DNA starvation/stationary phase protection protein [Gammaproteobacteria bacterium RIFCSPHIGHO2_02_FULL_38_33]OGT69599.1 MAG: DNA starvation/stationary phase protection protein [Gammaproteobacteria bacterium RIFCSPLOWO2_02_FULL_38_11]OGT75446.1 MAG: DNA starvation/stationary phase protection protein [Gammaproteobacteria bacterium RIFCSPLOWO2_12_FULL_38_14]